MNSSSARGPWFISQLGLSLDSDLNQVEVMPPGLHVENLNNSLTGHSLWYRIALLLYWCSAEVAAFLPWSIHYSCPGNSAPISKKSIIK